MAVKFLSEEWARAVTDALNSSEEFQQAAANQQVKLQQIVTDPPEGTGKYYFSLNDGRAEIDLGEVTDPGGDAEPGLRDGGGHQPARAESSECFHARKAEDPRQHDEADAASRGTQRDAQSAQRHRSRVLNQG